MKDEAQVNGQRGKAVEEISRAFEGIGEPETVVRVILGSIVPALADLAVLVLDDTGDPRVEVAHVRPSLAPRLRRGVIASMGALRETAHAYLRSSRDSCWISAVSDRTLSSVTGGDDALLALVRSFDVRSLIVVGLRASGRTIGALALARSVREEPFVAADFAAIQVLGRRIAIGMESAMLQKDIHEAADPHSLVGEAIHRWIRVFDLAWWGAAVVDGLDRRVETVNPAFAQLHGFHDPSLLAGLRFSELLAPDRAGDLDEWPSGAEGKVYESIHVRTDGQMIPVQVSVTHMDSERDPGLYVVTVQNLTDLKRTEERLQRAQRMEAVGRLAGGVAHEVNNMMTIILGFSDLLTREPNAPPQRQRELDEIRKAAMRAAKITSQLLAFSRQQVVQPVDLRLNRVVEEMVPVLRLMLPANVRVQTELSALDAVVRADRSQLEQVLINLAFNARDSMALGGSIKITTDSRLLDAAAGKELIGIPIRPGRYGLVSVLDNGHGMDPVTLAQVFEPFFTTKPVGSGTGLGLSTVYGIVKQSEGYVWVESIPGRGTSFTVCLPQVSGEWVEPLPAARAVPGQRRPGGMVLILEDEDGVRELAARILGDQGYRVVQAKHGSEVLAALRDDSSDPDLLLTDVVVPDMGTEELEREVRTLRPGLPILYMSGYPRDDIIYRGMLREDQPFLQKPFTTEDLTDGVGRMIAAS